MACYVELKGWVEHRGHHLSMKELQNILSADPRSVYSFGGEFFLRWNGFRARDHLGIILGNCPPGVVISNGEEMGRIKHICTEMDLDKAIEDSVRLRSDECVVALSGGVDSALVAQLAGRECVAVGIAESHDLKRARLVASELGLTLESVVLTPEAIEDALQRVIHVIPRFTPVDASIATTLFFISKWAGNRGYERILTGQGADELFGGYARYLTTDSLEKDLERDCQGLGMQLARDQAVAELNGTYFSLPYLDMRVVHAAHAIPAKVKVCNGVNKRPLRKVARQYLPSYIANYEKKSMQYGSGVWRVIQKLARKNGFKRSVQEYLFYLIRSAISN